MPVAAADVRIRYSTKTGTAGNSTASTGPESLGKWISTTGVGTAVNVVWDDVTAAETTAGTKDWRCLFIYNAHATDPMNGVMLFLSAQTAGGADIHIAADPTAASVVAATTVQAVQIASETTAPAGLGTWVAPTTAADGVALGDIPAGYCKAFWMRGTPTGSALAADGVTLGITYTPGSP